MIVDWSDAARADLREIANYIREHSPNAAKSVLADIRSVGSVLRDWPRMGRKGRLPDTREFIRRPYVIIYRLKMDRVVILRVVHAARDSVFRDETP